MKGLDAIFAPKSVAVLGASGQPGKVGHDILENIIKGGYTGTLYPVNVKKIPILCIKSHASILDIDDEIDLAMIALPPKIALTSVEECIKKGVKGIVIISAGFKEVGGEGAIIEKKIADICKENDIRLVGPNCLGVINPNPNVRLNASFSTHMPEYGNISFISQSGALCTAVLDFAADRGFGFSKFISIGNKADVNELDLLRYYHKDPNTDVIMIYMEELKMDAKLFIEEVKIISSGDRPTPVLVIKSGRTAAGAQAAASHTGSLAGSDAVYDAIFQEAGIMRVDSVNSLFDFSIAFAQKKIPRSNNVAIVTNAGGPGIVATDMTERSGLKLAKLQPETIEELKSHLPPAANINNPIDVIGDAAPERYENALEAVMKDENVDGTIVILTPQSMTDVIGTAESIVKIAKRFPKPIACSFMGIFDVSAGVKYLQKHGIPVYQFPENAARAMGALYTATKWLTRQKLAQFELTHDVEKAKEIIRTCLSEGRRHLGELYGTEILKCYGFKVLPTILAKNENEAAEIAEKIGYPVVLKIMSAQILHKSDAGGVKVGLRNADEVKFSFKEIIQNAKNYNPDARIDGVLVLKMAIPGEEVILGMKRYPNFGPLIMFGIGGVFVEIFKDVIFRVAPIGRNNARRMIKGIKGYALLSGFRGKPKADTDAIEKLLVSLSHMVVNHPEIMELDINPLLVHEEGDGATVADVRIILEKPKE
ncbi:MAG: acetate--CoA ligase family protein [Desulfobacterales bacterium]|nr:acetate--CoA ligase family protein [Desulfobacterales bacterium]